MIPFTLLKHIKNNLNIVNVSILHIVPRSRGVKVLSELFWPLVVRRPSDSEQMLVDDITYRSHIGNILDY